MFGWLKSLFVNPKQVVAGAVDSLDLLVPPLAKELSRVKAKFDALNPEQKSQWLIDTVQDFLRKQFGLLPEPPKGPTL